MQEIFEKISAMIDEERYFDVIELISDFLDSNPQYSKDNLISFSNPIEKVLYEKHFASPDNCIEFNLHKIHLYLGFSFLKVDDFARAQEVLENARKINPVSPEILLVLSDAYCQNGDVDEFKKTIDDLFTYNYYTDILKDNYRNLSKYHLMNRDIELFSAIGDFASCIDSDETDVEEMESKVVRLIELNVPIGFNPEIIELAGDLRMKSNSMSEEDDKFLEALYYGLSDFNSYFRGLAIDSNLTEITENVKIDIANDKIDEAISKIENFLENDTLDGSLNCKIFNNELERIFYHSHHDFDCNYVLLPKHRNYYYLHYLHGFCLEKQEKYGGACECYRKALKFNPYSIFVNLSLVRLKLSHHLPMKLSEIVNLANICYRKEDLLDVYECYIKFLKTHKRWEDVDDVDMLITYLKINDFKAITSSMVEMLKDDGFNVVFSEDVIDAVKDTIEYYSDKELENLELYEGYLDDILEFNANMGPILNAEISLQNTGILKDFADGDLNGAYVLVHEKLSQRHYQKIQFLRADFNDIEFDSSDSFVCYAYRQVTGAIAFLLLSVSSVDDELKIYDRIYFRDVVFKRDLLDDAEITFLNELSQFSHYVNESDDNYSRWLDRNLSGDKDTDRKFLLGELKNIDDDFLDIKRDSITAKLKDVIDFKDLLKEEIPSQKLIEKARNSILKDDLKKALVMIEQFLDEYPMLYSDGYMDKYFYFTDAEEELYKRYSESSKRIIRLPESQNYCGIYNLKAEILIAFQKYDDAIDCLDKSLNLNPFNVESMILMSEAFYSDGDVEYAINSLKKALIFNTSLDVHSEIYERLAKIYAGLGEELLSEDLLALSEAFAQSDFDSDLNKNLIVDNEILVGFNPDVVLENQEIARINEKIFNGNIIDNVLQATKPLIDEWPNIASEKLKRFILDNRVFEGYEILYDKFEASLMHTDETDADRFYNFENEIEREIFERLNPQTEHLKCISGDLRVCELLDTYAHSLKYLLPGKANTILQESLKLNPVNMKTLSYIIEIHLKLEWLDEVRPYFDELLRICWDKKMLIRTYENLSQYYRYRGLRDVSKFLDEFCQSLRDETFENDDHIEFFKKLDIQLGFDENMVEMMARIDREIYSEMVRVNEMLMR